MNHHEEDMPMRRDNINRVAHATKDYPTSVDAPHYKHQKGKSL